MDVYIQQKKETLDQLRFHDAGKKKREEKQMDAAFFK